MPVIENDLGKITMPESLIERIVSRSVREICRHVALVSPKEGLGDFFGRSRNDRGVAVEFEEDSIEVDIYVVVEYGVNIVEVCNDVMDKVKTAVYETTGLEIEKVNVNVEGIKRSET